MHLGYCIKLVHNSSKCLGRASVGQVSETFKVPSLPPGTGIESKSCETVRIVLGPLEWPMLYRKNLGKLR